MRILNCYISKVGKTTRNITYIGYGEFPYKTIKLQPQ
jgi:hypothetical protein